VTLTVDGNTLKRSEVATALRNTQKHSHTIIAPQKTFDERKVANFRKFCIEFFDDGNPPKDPLELARHGADRLKSKHDELKATVSGSKYPFVEQLDDTIDLLVQVVGKPDEWYLNDFDRGDDLLDAKENLIDPIQSFLNGAQRSIYDAAAALLMVQSNNLAYLPAGSDEAIRAGLDDPNAFRGNKMAVLKTATDDLSAQVDTVIQTHRALVTTGIEERKTELITTRFYLEATTDTQERVLSSIDQTLARIATENQVALILQMRSSFEASEYPALLDQLSASRKGGGVDAPPHKQTVSVRTIPVPGASGVLESEEDVDKYLTALRGALVQTLSDGKRISL